MQLYFAVRFHITTKGNASVSGNKRYDIIINDDSVGNIIEIIPGHYFTEIINYLIDHIYFLLFDCANNKSYVIYYLS